MKLLGAVVVNYNAGDHLARCVTSLSENGVGTVVVVDNGSTDGSLRGLQERGFAGTVLHLPNPGYGAAMNAGVEELRGLAVAEDAKADVAVLLVNPDTVLSAGSVSQLLAALEGDARLALVGPRLEGSDGALYPSARRFPSFVDGVGHAVVGLVAPNNRWSRRYKMQTEPGIEPESREVDWVSGAVMCVRLRAFSDMEGFDHRYWMYMEDVALCWRLRQAGWTVLYEPAACVVHVQGVSTSGKPYRSIVAHHRSQLRYHARTSRGVDRLAVPIIAAGLVARIPLAWAQRWITAKRNPADARGSASL